MSELLIWVGRLAGLVGVGAAGCAVVVRCVGCLSPGRHAARHAVERRHRRDGARGPGLRGGDGRVRHRSALSGRLQRSGSRIDGAVSPSRGRDRGAARQLPEARLERTHRLRLAPALPLQLRRGARAAGAGGRPARCPGARARACATARRSTSRAWAAVTLTDRGMSDDKLICSDHRPSETRSTGCCASSTSMPGARAVEPVAAPAGPQCLRWLVCRRRRTGPGPTPDASLGRPRVLLTPNSVELQSK